MPARCLTLLTALFFALCFLGKAAPAQQPATVVMLSDIHFDPFHDPGKLPQLRAESIGHWPAILSAPATPTQAADLDALQAACHTRALDTWWSLLQTSLTAAHAAGPRPAFVTLSGDLLAHEFPCRFQHLTPGSTAADLAAFSAKTVAFVLAQTQAAFPRLPVYATLGNNDSGCADYRETPADPFLQQTSAAVATAAHIPPGSLTPEGDYSTLLPAPLQHTRLIALNDIFDGRSFNTCADAADRAPEKAQLDWLRKELTEARAHNEQVWVMAHMPPGVDVFSSYRSYVFKPAALCTATPRPFLADTALADTLLDFAPTIRLALFGHTHMDEFRLLRRTTTTTDEPASNPTTPSSRPEPQTPTPATLSSRPERSAVERPAVPGARAETGVPNELPRGGEEGTSQPSAATTAIPAKIVPSITPFFGNHPAFLVATVDPRTAVLKDWRTVVSPGPEGSTPPWTDAYRFTTAYNLPDFSAASAAKLADSFTADPTGQSPASSTFRQHFYAGDIGLYALGLAQIWPAYACAIREDRPSAVQHCICETQPHPSTPTQ